MRKIGLKNIVWKEGECYVSWNINTGISSFGDTKKEALESLHEALSLYFEDTPISRVNKVERLDIVPSIFEYAYANPVKASFKSPSGKWILFCIAKRFARQIQKDRPADPHGYRQNG